MAGNNFSRLSDRDALAAIAVLLDALNGPQASQYGVTNSQRLGLQTQLDDFTEAVTEFDIRKSEYLASSAAKSTKRATALSQLSHVATTIYNNPSITPALLANAGLALRDTTKTPVIPKIPQDLVANPFANGTVKLTWKRNGNPYGVMFSVETRGHGGTWTVVGQTRKQEVTLNDFAAGVYASFRVRALTSTASSLASGEAVIYNSGQEVALEVAA